MATNCRGRLIQQMVPHAPNYYHKAIQLNWATDPNPNPNTTKPY